MYLETLAAWIDQQGFDFVYWNMMHEPYFFSIATLPDSAKAAITEHLRSVQMYHPSIVRSLIALRIL
jgi:hypothetical protein